MPARLVLVVLVLVIGSTWPAYGQRTRKPVKPQAAKTEPAPELPSEPVITGDPGTRIRGLLEQKFKIYLEREENYRKALDAHMVDQLEVVRVNLDSLRAQLELYEAPAKRIPILEKIVENMKILEDAAKSKALQSPPKPGQNPLRWQEPVLRAKLNRIDWEIALERERLKAQEAAAASSANQPATTSPSAK